MCHIQCICFYQQKAKFMVGGLLECGVPPGRVTIIDMGFASSRGLVKATEALSMTTDANSKYRRLEGAFDITLKARQPVLGLMF